MTATWQRGFELEDLRAAVSPFKASDKGCTQGAFTAFRERDLADALADGHYLGIRSGEVTRTIVNRAAPEAAVVWRRARTTTKLTDFTGRIAAEVHAGDLVVSRLGVHDGHDRAAVELLQRLIEQERMGSQVVWLHVWQESATHGAVLSELLTRNLGVVQLAAVKIPASSELRGIYAIGGLDVRSARAIRKLPRTETYGLRRLTDLRVRNSLLGAAVDEVDRVVDAAWADHYSSYNKGHAWSAVALRGYSPDATYIEKPAEMSKSWKAAAPGWEAMRVQDTVLRPMLPALEPLIAMIPGEHQRIRLMRLAPGGGELTRHADITDPEAGTTDGKVLRIHIPLRTNDKVLFSSWTLGGVQYTRNMTVGSVWYLDTRKPHTARNDGDTERIHLVVDAYSSPELLEHLSAHDPLRYLERQP